MLAFFPLQIEDTNSEAECKYPFFPIEQAPGNINMVAEHIERILYMTAYGRSYK